MADPIANPFDGLQGIFDKIIGSKTVGTDQQSLTTQQLLQNILNNTVNTNQSQTGTQQGTSASTVSSNADVTQLQKVFEQQQAGITPDMLKAIFTEGAKGVPQLVSTTANAVGARPGTNSALATSLTDLNTNLTSQAAMLNQKMLGDSATTAAHIADLTKQQTTAGSTTQNSTQALQTLLQQLQNQNQNTSTDQQKRDDSTTTTGINSKQTGVAAGLAGLVSLLGSNPDLLKAIPGLGSLIGGGLIGSPNPSIPQNPNLDTNPDVNGSVSDPIPMPEDISIGYADGGIVDQAKNPKLLQITDSKSGAPNTQQLLALLGGTGTGGSSGGSSSASGGIDLSSLLGGVGGADGGTGTTGSSTPSGAPLGFNPSPQTMFNLVTAIATMNPIAIAAAMAKAVMSNTPTANAGTGSPGAAGPGSTGPGTGPGAVGSVSIGAPVGEDGTVGSIGNAAPGDSVSVSGPVGDSGDSSGDSGDGGWADGGVIPKQAKDAAGITDGFTIKVSGGEAMLPKDVVDMVGPDFIESLISLYHVPAARQKAEA